MSTQGGDNGTGINNQSRAIMNWSGISNSHIDVGGVNITIGRDTPSSSSQEIQGAACNEEMFVGTCNDCTRIKTQDKVTSTFDQLKSPSRRVNPEYVITEYYKGATGLKSGEYDPGASATRERMRHFLGEVVKLDEILNGVDYAALVANAGCGKTVAAKRFAQMVLEKKVPSLNRVKLVHYVTMAELDFDTPHTAYDLIFVQPLGNRLSGSLREFGSNWLKTNGSEVLLVFDGLDQAPWTLENKQTIAYDQPGDALVVMHNILNKDLFAGCKIVITSREHSIRHLSDSIRPQRTIALAGLVPKDREFLIKEFGGENGETIWKHLQQKSPGLFSLCENPAFLVFTSAVMVDKLGNGPETMAGLLMEVLNYFAQSEQRRELEFEYVLERLKKLAFIGTLEKRVKFNSAEIEHLGLTASQVQDLVAVAPKKTSAHHFKLMERSMTLFFCHQMIQEALTALHISEFKIDDFVEFVQTHFDDPHFEVVRKITAGIILDSMVDTSNISEIRQKDIKANALRNYLKKFIGDDRGRRNESEDLPLFSLLYECGDGADGIIRDEIHHVTSHEKLRGESLYVVSSVMRRCDYIETVTLSTVCPSDWDIKVFVNGLRKCRSGKIMVVKVGEMKEEESFRLLQEMLSITTVENLIFSDCPLTATNAVAMGSSDGPKAKKVTTLDLSGNREIEDGAYLHLGRLITQTEASDLQFNSCNLSGNRLTDLKTSLDGYSGKIVRLGLSSNEDLTPRCLKSVGEIVRKGNVEQLNVSRCKLRKDQIHELSQSLRGYSCQMERFDVSRNETLEPKAYEDIGRIVAWGGVQNLNISTCGLEKEKLKALTSSSEFGDVQMKSLDVAWNGETLDYAVLGQLVEQWKVTELICHGCFLRKQNVVDFVSSLRVMKTEVKITHGSENVQSTTTSVDEFLNKIND